MNSKVLALTIVLASCFFTSIVNGQPAIHATSHAGINLQSKGTKKLPYYRASDDSPFEVSGSDNAPFSKLTFTLFKQKQLNSIYVCKNNASFVLGKGSYIISFTGTCIATGGAGPSSKLEFGIQVGSKIFNRNVYTIETDPSYDFIQLLSSSQLFNFKKKTKISFVVRDSTPGASIIVNQRSMSILKIS